MTTTPHAELAASDPVMAALVERHGELSVEGRRRRRPAVDAYGMLLRSVIGQQLSVKAAATIYDRVLALFGGRTPPPEKLLEVEPQELRDVGLSWRKVEYVRDLAEHVLSGELELDRLDRLSDERGDRRDHRGPRLRPLERADVPDLLPRAPRRAADR